jgi:anaphase-promoting complex subunit 4
LTFEEPSKFPEQCLFVGQPSLMRDGSPRRCMNQVVVDFPLLSKREARDYAKLGTASRALAHYSMRVVKEMREAWFGSDSNTGAREFGPRWIKTLEVKQKDQFGGTFTSLLGISSKALTSRI